MSLNHNLETTVLIHSFACPSLFWKQLGGRVCSLRLFCIHLSLPAPYQSPRNPTKPTVAPPHWRRTCSTLPLPPRYCRAGRRGRGRWREPGGLCAQAYAMVTPTLVSQSDASLQIRKWGDEPSQLLFIKGHSLENAGI